MVKAETKKFVEENRQLVEFVAEHGSSEVRKIATALLLAVDLERKEEEHAKQRIY